MSLPLYGFLEGDTIGLLILAEEHETVQSLAGKLRDAASVRVAPAAREVQVVYNKRVLDPALTLAQAGFNALDRFDVRFDVKEENSRGVSEDRQPR